jgi:hypothetical protein
LIDQQDICLLQDLVKLLKKYGPDSFVRLANIVSSPETMQDIGNMLGQLGRIVEVDRKINTAKLKGNATSARDILASLKETEHEKYNLLMEFFDDFQIAMVLPTMREIREFADNYNFSTVKQTSRQRAINPIMKELSLLPLAEVRLITQSLAKSEMNDKDRDLEGWSNIILNKDGKHK